MTLIWAGSERKLPSRKLMNVRSFNNSTRKVLEDLAISIGNIIAWFVVIFGINTTSNISKLLYDL